LTAARWYCNDEFAIVGSWRRWRRSEMNEERKPRIENVENLELIKETLQDLTAPEAEAARGGLLPADTSAGEQGDCTLGLVATTVIS
jgi:hypothetical protein